MQSEDKGDLVVVAMVGTLQQADVVRASLEAQGIPALIMGEHASNWLAHMGPAIHPWGVKVAVPPAFAEAAREIIERGRSAQREQQQEADQAAAPDDYARAAFRSAVLSMFVPPFVFLTLVNLLRARDARRRRAPLDEARYRRNMTWAAVLGSLAAAVLALALLQGWIPLPRW